MHPLVFLDVDGVLNSRDWLFAPEQQENELRFPGEAHLSMNREMVALVNRILAGSGAKVVVSSSWRCAFEVPQLREILARAGLEGDVIGATPLPVFGVPRGCEIQAWLDQHGGAGKEAVNFGWPAPFVILDDDRDMAHLLPQLVRTTWAKGLEDIHVDAALAMLRWDLL
jgi:hypothetical protein